MPVLSNLSTRPSRSQIPSPHFCSPGLVLVLSLYRSNLHPLEFNTNTHSIVHRCSHPHPSRVSCHQRISVLLCSQINPSPPTRVGIAPSFRGIFDPISESGLTRPCRAKVPHPACTTHQHLSFKPSFLPQPVAQHCSSGRSWCSSARLPSVVRLPGVSCLTCPLSYSALDLLPHHLSFDCLSFPTTP